MMDLKDKLNLCWKFLFLAVFTYGVISITCCKKSCSSYCKQGTSQVSQCCKSNSQVQKQCDPNCIKPCCASKK